MNTLDQQVQAEIIKTTETVLQPQAVFSLFRENLAAYIHELINHNFSMLISLLYRLDVNENKLKQVLASAPATDAGLIIADLMIERQVQKIKTRQQYKQPGDAIPDDEKW